MPDGQFILFAREADGKWRPTVSGSLAFCRESAALFRKARERAGVAPRAYWIVRNVAHGVTCWRGL